MAGWHHQLYGCEFEWTLGVGDGQGGLVCCSSWDHKESDTTEWLNWTELSATYCQRRQRQHTPVLLPGKSHGRRSLVSCSPWGHEESKSWIGLSDFTFTFHFHALEKEMATHSSVLAWRIPGMGEPGGLQSMGSHRVEHDWSDLAVAAAGFSWEWLLTYLSFLLFCLFS